ncbi:MAG TPA: hypothetical protein VKM72_29730 [Thermoanaerobaculia bacterium]|nr:hypothetical protein [Thermoanaerobaculia bacterium]
MPSLNTYADVVRDWRMLLDAVERSPEVKEEVEKERLGVERALGEVEALKARQDELTALRQQVTQELKASVVRGKESAIQFRAILKAKFGPKNERLVHFKVAPIRPRRMVVEKLPAAPAKPAA